MGETVKTEEVKKVETEKVPETMKVKFKCNYPKKDKDSKLIFKDGKQEKYKPDDVATIPGKEALKLIAKAFAVEA